MTRLSVLSVALAGLLLHGGTQAQQEIGFVIEIDGKWFLERPVHKEIYKGSTLPSGGVIRARTAPSEPTAIIIGDLNGKVILFQHCESGKDCVKPITLPTRPHEAQSFASRVVQAVREAWDEAPLKYAIMGSRGKDAPHLTEAVIVLKHDDLDLSALFAEANEGNYAVKFVPAINASREDPAISLFYTWSRGERRAVSASGLRPGLYVVQAQEQGDNIPVAPSLDAWVVIASPDDYDSFVTCYRRASELVQSWDNEGVSASTILSFRRAFLQSLLSKANPCRPAPRTK